MSDAERMYAIKETARRIVEACRGENLGFINSPRLAAMERAAAQNDGSRLVDLVEWLREKDEDVIRIIEVILESMS